MKKPGLHAKHIIKLPAVLAMWGQPEFKDVLRRAIAGLGTALPLQEGLSAGSYALEEPLEVMVIDTVERPDCIEAKVGIFYNSLTPGCACAGDPTVESAQNEHITVLVSIDKSTADATIERLEE
jgi:hypothetical protein